jgi:hypothetical protein
VIDSKGWATLVPGSGASKEIFSNGFNRSPLADRLSSYAPIAATVRSRNRSSLRPTGNSRFH